MANEFIHKKILFGDDVLDKLEAGVKAVHDAVGTTMGAEGQLVMFEEGEKNPYPTVTKDGVSVASMISLSDQAENNGAQFAIQAARKQVYETGDGTTLTTILTYKLLKEGRKRITNGNSVNSVIAGMRDATKDVSRFIEDISVKDLGIEDIKNIARVSTNNDKDLADKIGEAVFKTGKHGMVVQEKSRDDKHSVEYQEGYQLDTGIMDQVFTNIDNKIFVAEKPYILVTDHNIFDATKLKPVVKMILGDCEKDNPVIVVIAPQISGDVLQLMKRNITDPKTLFHMVHIRPTKDLKPQKLRMVMEDIAAVTGARFLSTDSGYQVDKITLDDLGTCKEISSIPTKTLITGSTEATEERIKMLQGRLEIETDIEEGTKEMIEESIARLMGGVATIKVGGKNISEQMETLDRVDDAVRACKSAQEMGYVRGGGVAMLEAYRNLAPKKEFSSPGYDVVMDSLKYPAETILRNANNEGWQGIINSIVSGNNGYDIHETDISTIDMIEWGIIDPTKVIVYALKNAVSAAISMLQTSVMIIAKEK